MKQLFTLIILLNYISCSDSPSISKLEKETRIRLESVNSDPYAKSANMSIEIEELKGLEVERILDVEFYDTLSSQNLAQIENLVKMDKAINEANAILGKKVETNPEILILRSSIDSLQKLSSKNEHYYRFKYLIKSTLQNGINREHRLDTCIVYYDKNCNIP